MKRTPKLLFFFLFFSVLAFGQEWTLPLTGKVEKSEKKLKEL